MTVKGTITYKATFEVNLDISREEFDLLPFEQQEELIQENTDPTLVEFYSIYVDGDIKY